MKHTHICRRPCFYTSKTMYLSKQMLHSAREEALHVRRMVELIGEKYFAILHRFPKHSHCTEKLSATTQP